MSPRKVAFLTAGGLAPCLSSAVGYLVELYNQEDPDTVLVAYRDGYKGLLLGDSIDITPSMREQATLGKRPPAVL